MLASRSVRIHWRLYLAAGIILILASNVFWFKLRDSSELELKSEFWGYVKCVSPIGLQERVCHSAGFYYRPEVADEEEGAFAVDGGFDTEGLLSLQRHGGCIDGRLEVRSSNFADAQIMIKSEANPNLCRVEGCSRAIFLHRLFPWHSGHVIVDNLLPTIRSLIIVQESDVSIPKGFEWISDFCVVITDRDPIQGLEKERFNLLFDHPLIYGLNDSRRVCDDHAPGGDDSILYFEEAVIGNGGLGWLVGKHNQNIPDHLSVRAKLDETFRRIMVARGVWKPRLSHPVLDAKPRIVIIQRLLKRLIEDVDGLVSHLQQQFPSMEVVLEVFERKTFEEQMHVFSEAAIIVAVEGAAMENAYFARPGTGMVALVLHDGENLPGWGHPGWEHHHYPVVFAWDEWMHWMHICGVCMRKDSDGVWEHELVKEAVQSLWQKMEASVNDIPTGSFSFANPEVFSRGFKLYKSLD